MGWAVGWAGRARRAGRGGVAGAARVQTSMLAPNPATSPLKVVNTAWAMLALMAVGWHRIDPAPLTAGAACLLRAQLPTGDWPQQHISGVFNRNAMITYANYRNIFPLWALGEYAQKVLS